MEFGIHSPIGITCQDQHTLTIHDFIQDPTTITLLHQLFQTYNHPHFLPHEIEKLHYVDDYLDIPLIQATLDYSYEAYHRLIRNQCTIIPSWYLNNAVMVDMALEHHHYPTFVHAYQHMAETNDIIWCMTAAHYQHLDIVQFLHQRIMNKHNPPPPLYLAYSFANHLEGLTWILSSCPWYPIDLQVYKQSAKLGNLSCLKLLLTANTNTNTNMTDDEYNDILYEAALHGHLDCVDYLVSQHHFTMDETICWAAAKNGHLSILQYLHEHNCPWDRTTTFVATTYNHLPCLEYAVNHGCPVDCYTSSQAAAQGHLHILQFLHQNASCPWDHHTLLFAHLHNHTHIYHYALTHNCPQS